MKFELLPEGFRWPSGDSRIAATFSITPDVVTSRVGIAFERGYDDLDFNRSAYFRLPSGRPVFLVWYDRAPVLVLELRVDAADNIEEARADAMEALKISPQEVAWVPPDQ